MKGFDNRFQDLPDFILQCTAEIWEGRGIAELDWHYADDLLVRTPAGISRGNTAGKASTMATLTEFPDRQLLGEDVIWTGDEEEGFLSSHRIMSTATHMGGAFGAATGRKVKFRTIADTFCLNNRVWDEWLIRDNAAIAVQLGSTAKDAAQSLLDNGDHSKPLTPDTDVQGPYKANGNSNEWGIRHAELLVNIMSYNFQNIKNQYDRACHLSTPGGEESHGWSEIEQFWIALRSAVPNADFKIAHQIGRSDRLLPPRSAIRWSLNGRHEGWGRYGAASGAKIHIMGVSHVEFGPNGVRREITLFDDIAVWKQILQQSRI